MLPFDEHSPDTEDATQHVAVIYCTFCGNRFKHVCESGELSASWSMTPREIRTMRRELPKISCTYCQGSIDIRVIDGDGGLRVS